MSDSTEIARHFTMRLALLIALFSSVGCGYLAARMLSGEETRAPTDFSFLESRHACYLELERGVQGLRMNCFHLDGVLHIHSSRWSKLPRFSGESWTVSILRSPNVRVEIDGKIYAMTASPITSEAQRQAILDDRGYWYHWDGITVFRFVPTQRSGIVISR